MSRIPFSGVPRSPRPDRWRRFLLSVSLVVPLLTGLGAASAAGLLGKRAQWTTLRVWQDVRSVAAQAGSFARTRFVSATGRRPAGTDTTTPPSPSPSPSPSTSPVAAGGGAVSQNTSQPRRVALPSALLYTDRGSAAYTRFKNWVDAAVNNGGTGYGFTASEAAMMYQLSPESKYCTLAVNVAERQVSAAEAAIAAGGRPEVSNDSYLEVGTMISDVAATLDTCGAFITASQRSRWSAYAEQAVWNVWNYGSAQWGGRSFPWSGWSVSNPGNNYYYSFLEATMYWALASRSSAWMNFLQTNKLPALREYFARLPGGGSSEGTGYGTSHMRLFSLYRVWRDATGADLASASPHATDSIYYWAHATVPTMDRFAPIGDQARNSIPELYDYHRRLVLEARQLALNPDARNVATWWLRNISVTQMTSGFNYRHDLLPAGTTPAQPGDLIYHAKGVGHLFARTGWDRSAMWVAIVAGPYNESHAHQDQGSFTLFAGDWLAVTANIWSGSGINQGTDVHNLVRFVRNGTVARQCESSTRISTLDVSPGSGGSFTANANLTPSFCDNSTVGSWQRQFTFANRRLTVRDQFAVASGTTATFQVNVPVAPTLVNSREAVAGRLRVRVLEPANATINSNFNSGKYVEDGARYRIDVTGGTTGYLVELSEI